MIKIHLREEELLENFIKTLLSIQITISSLDFHNKRILKDTDDVLPPPGILDFPTGRGSKEFSSYLVIFFFALSTRTLMRGAG